MQGKDLENGDRERKAMQNAKLKMQKEGGSQFNEKMVSASLLHFAF
jgi:hypothetical protein